MPSREPTKQQMLQIRKILRVTKAFVDRQMYYPRRHVFLDKVVLGLLSKSLVVAQAVICLVDRSFPEEAFGLSRTLVEIAINLRYIANRSSELRAKRYVHYFAKVKMEWMRRGLKHYTWKESELRKMMPDYKKTAALARKYPDKYSWAKTRKQFKGGVASMAAELDSHERTPDGEAVKWEFDYDWIYFWTSQYVHANVASIDSHAWEPPKSWERFKPFSVLIAPHRGKHTAGLAVFNTGLYLHKVLVLAFRTLGTPYPDELSKPLEQLLTSMSKDEDDREKK